MNKQKILEWYCENSKIEQECLGDCKKGEECTGYYQLEKMLDELIDSAPTICPNPQATFTNANVMKGYHFHCKEVEKWKQDKKGEGDETDLRR